MRLLLDTLAFLWWVEDSPRLSRRARSAIADPDNECLVSLVSCWEMAIKVSLGKLQVPKPLERFVPEQLATNDFRQMAIDFRHVARVATMPFHHRDPFDRLLAAQAVEGELTLISGNPVFRKYGARRLW